MTRDETSTLFKACETARADATAAGANVEEAHKAAKAVWNAWAKRQMVERKRIEARGQWEILERKGEPRSQWFQRHTQVMQNWLLQARADFSTVRIAPSKEIDFRGFLFPGEADFTDAELTAFTFFTNSIFSGPAWFRSLKTNGVDFANVTFLEQVWLRQAVFSGAGYFVGARFMRKADFIAIRAQSAFNLEGTHFEYLPDFLQAHFEEAPRLDDLKVVGRVIPLHTGPDRGTPKNRWQRCWWAIRYAGGRLRSLPMRAARGVWHRLSSADRSAPSRWRALKRLAIQGHDIDRELQFHAREVLSQRFAGDWPFPRPIWKVNAWAGFLRFWAGLLYQIFSNFGRSLLRPLFFWALCIVIFAVYFLGQNPDVTEARRKLDHEGFVKQVVAYSTVAWQAASGKMPTACFNKSLPTGDVEKDSLNGFTGLTEPVRTWTNIVNEALTIAYHNAVILLDSSGDSAHRAFGCLYGVERYGGNPIAYVPRPVSIASGIQKFLSAVLIFLFSLAVRNMLKMK